MEGLRSQRVGNGEFPTIDLGSGGCGGQSAHVAGSHHAGDRPLSGEPPGSARRLPRDPALARRAWTPRRVQRARRDDRGSGVPLRRDRDPSRGTSRPDRSGSRRRAAYGLRGVARPFGSSLPPSSGVSPLPRRSPTSSGSSFSPAPTGARTTGPSPILRASPVDELPSSTRAPILRRLGGGP